MKYIFYSGEKDYFIKFIETEPDENYIINQLCLSSSIDEYISKNLLFYIKNIGSNVNFIKHIEDFTYKCDDKWNIIKPTKSEIDYIINNLNDKLFKVNLLI